MKALLPFLAATLVAGTGFFVTQHIHCEFELPEEVSCSFIELPAQSTLSVNVDDTIFRPAAAAQQPLQPVVTATTIEPLPEPEPVRPWVCEMPPEYPHTDEGVEAEVVDGGTGIVVSCDHPAEVARIDTLTLREFQVVNEIERSGIIVCQFGAPTLRQQQATRTVAYTKVETVMLDEPARKQPLTATVFPNPMREQATIRLSDLPEQPYTISIYDMAGKLRANYANVQGNNHMIVRDNLAAGIYIYQIQIEGTDQTPTGRLVVQ